MEHIITIDPKRCIGCRACVRDCPQMNIAMQEKKAVILDQHCLKCGHCKAVCPKEAVSISGYSMEPTPIDPTFRFFNFSFNLLIG